MGLLDWFKKDTKSATVIPEEHVSAVHEGPAVKVPPHDIIHEGELLNPDRLTKSDNATAKTEEKKSFLNSSGFIKAKGITKIAFGALVLLQPHYAFLIAASACTAWVGYSTVESFRDPKNKGSFFEKLKNAAGKETGAMIGLLAPYVGIAIAAFGGLSYLSNHAQGAQGFFQGGLMATAIGTVGLPALGVACVADGLVNTLGYESHFFSKAYELTLGLFKGARKLIGIAESGPDKQKEVANAMVHQTHGASKHIQQEARGVAQDLAPHAQTITDNLAGHKTPHTLMSRVTGFLGSFTHREDQRRNEASQNERTRE